jgi:hypothetical protein
MITFTVATKDPMNTNFHRLLAFDRVEKGVNMIDVTIPDAPITSPFANSKVTAERPVPQYNQIDRKIPFLVRENADARVHS